MKQGYSRSDERYLSVIEYSTSFTFFIPSTFYMKHKCKSREILFNCYMKAGVMMFIGNEKKDIKINKPGKTLPLEKWKKSLIGKKIA